MSKSEAVASTEVGVGTAPVTPSRCEGRGLASAEFIHLVTCPPLKIWGGGKSFAGTYPGRDGGRLHVPRIWQGPRRGQVTDYELHVSGIWRRVAVITL